MCTHSHTQMYGQHDIYKHCCELEEMRKKKVRSETQASRLSGLACCITDQRGAGERMTVSAICLLGLAVLFHPAFICLVLLQISPYMHAFTGSFHHPACKGTWTKRQGRQLHWRYVCAQWAMKISSALAGEQTSQHCSSKPWRRRV